VTQFVYPEHDIRTNRFPHSSSH